MPVPAVVCELVQRFEDNRAAYRSGAYNETQARREFIDPFFAALGWDVDNTHGYAEAYKDVIHEDAIKVGEGTKAPDYAFRIGGARKFFVEAKKPSVNVREDISPAYQLRRYAWSARLPLSILTDFEEFAVYDCRGKPDKTDKASTGRVMMVTYKDYIEKWDEIAAVFSREAVLKGSFDRYAESAKAKHGTAEVDDAFLAEIERYRELLARSIALRNPRLTQRQLNFAVQITIDRIIFLRICEDRGVENYARLQGLTAAPEIYPALLDLFRQADSRYNSGLFHFSPEKGQAEAPDTLTPALKLDDKVLKDILASLYYPDSPYEFSVFTADILGQVYEQFLGKVIRLTAGHRAIVEDKPEVKKAGGVFYTPTYIVEYIVKNTLGPLLDGKRPGDIGVGRGDPIRVLDPACGSGSFLLGAYQFLLDWYRDGYLQEPEKYSKGSASDARRGSASDTRRGAAPALYQAAGGEWRLTTAERKRILLAHIYGVDIDPQAVEVTKLSLLLKVLEGETQQTVGSQLSLFGERVLPDLSRSIQCGNSLIGPDYYSGAAGQLSLLDDEESYRVNAFDWQASFPDAFRNGGFDAVIGNPPYVRQELLGIQKQYFERHYQVYHGVADLYAYFIERGISLLRSGGFFSYIVANKWMRANYGEPLRRWLKTKWIEEIIDFGDLPVFETATTYPCIIRIKGDQKPSLDFLVTQVKTLNFSTLTHYVEEHAIGIKQSRLADAGWTLVDEQSADLLAKIRQSGINLGKFVQGRIFYGIKTGFNEAFVIDETTRARLISEDPKSEEIIKPFLMGRDVLRYGFPQHKRYLILIPRGFTNARSLNLSDPWKWMQKEYPAISHYLNPHAEAANKRYDKGDYWWELRSCHYYDAFDMPKIIIPAIIQRASYMYDENGFYSNDKTCIIPTNDLYLVGVLNSKVPDFVMHHIASTKQGGYYEYKPMYVEQLPIRQIDFTNPTEKSYHDQIVALVRTMLDQNKQLAFSSTPGEKTHLQRRIEAVDREIDRLVYQLYGLTEEEIKIVEGTV